MADNFLTGGYIMIIMRIMDFETPKTDSGDS